MKYNSKWHQVGLLFFNYQNDAWSNKHKIHIRKVYNVWTILWLPFVVHVMLFLHNYSFVTFISVLCAVRVQCPVWLFCVVPWCHAFPVCNSDIFWVIFEIVPFSPIILVTLLSIHPTYTAFILQRLYILKSFRLPSSSHLYLQELQHLLTNMFLFHYHGLWCPV